MNIIEKTARAFKSPLTAVNMRGTGKKIKQTVGDVLLMLMGMSTKENLRMTRPMGMESITTRKMVAVMKGTGSRTRSKVKDWK